MQLLDDHLFQHWRNEVVTKEDVLAKSNSPDDLAKRIAAAERGIFDEPQPTRSGKTVEVARMSTDRRK